MFSKSHRKNERKFYDLEKAGGRRTEDILVRDFPKSGGSLVSALKAGWRNLIWYCCCWTCDTCAWYCQKSDIKPNVFLEGNFAPVRDEVWAAIAQDRGGSIVGSPIVMNRFTMI